MLAGALLLLRSLGDTLSGTATASDSIDSGPSPFVRVSNGRGQVSVEGEKDLRSVKFEVTKHATGPDPATARRRASEVPVDISREDGEISLTTDGGGGTGADYALRVPAGATVEIESGAGSVEVSGVSGDVTVLAESGDVEIQDGRGSVTVEAPRGDVSISGVRTDAGQMDLSVGTGDVELSDLSLGTLETRVEAGDVTFSGRFSGGGRVLVETGNIIVGLPPEDTRELTLEARIGGVERKESPAEESGKER
jgi:DUF4097 and DUF4098 domain-containing protein YvlB